MVPILFPTNPEDYTVLAWLDVDGGGGSWKYNTEKNRWDKVRIKPTYTASEVGAAATNHTHAWDSLDNLPQFFPPALGEGGAAAWDDPRLSNSRPASDVAAWAKAADKPGYTASEVGGVAEGDARLSDSRPASDVAAWAKALGKPTYTAAEVGGVAEGDVRLSDSRPASDVSAWAKSATKPDYTAAEVGGVAAGDSRLSDSRPASDVAAWAKALSKPTYTAAEVGAPAGSGNSTGTNTGDQDLGGLITKSAATAMAVAL